METDSRTIFSGFSHVMICAFCARVKRKITFHIKFWLRKSIWPLLLSVEENEFIDFLCVCDINDFIYTLCGAYQKSTSSPQYECFYARGQTLYKSNCVAPIVKDTSLMAFRYTCADVCVCVRTRAHKWERVVFLHIGTTDASRWLYPYARDKMSHQHDLSIVSISARLYVYMRQTKWMR